MIEALQQRAEGDLDLRAGQRRAEAEVHAAAEGQRLDVGARHVELVGIGKAGRIVVAGAEQREHLLAGWDRHPAHLDARFGDPVGQLRRAVVAQEFVGQVGKQ